MVRFLAIVFLTNQTRADPLVASRTRIPKVIWVVSRLLYRHKNIVCEIMDGYDLLLKTYLSTRLMKKWLDRHCKHVVQNGRIIQSLYS